MEEVSLLPYDCEVEAHSSSTQLPRHYPIEPKSHRFIPCVYYDIRNRAVCILRSYYHFPLQCLPRCVSQTGIRI